MSATPLVGRRPGELGIAAGDTTLLKPTATTVVGLVEGEIAWARLVGAIEATEPLRVRVLYGDFEGGQRVISQFALRYEDERWLVSRAGTSSSTGQIPGSLAAWGRARR